jgi:hypothetical protein
MRSLLVILVYTGSFMGFFFLFSIIGLLWIDSYPAIIGNACWFVLYTIFLGWWLAAFPAKEFYKPHEFYYIEFKKQY